VEQFDEHMKLADFWLRRHLDRIHYEWRASFGVWALLAAEAPFMTNNKFSCSNLVVLAIGSLLLSALHARWLKKIWEANDKDKQQYFEWSDRAATLLDSRERPKPPKAQDWTGDWSMQSQMGVTILLLFLDLSLSWSKALSSA